MKIVVCVDNCDHGLKLAEFTNRLRFPGAEYHFVHILLSFMAAPYLDLENGAAPVVYSAAQRVALDDAQLKLSDLAGEFRRRYGVTVYSRACYGNPAQEVLHYADRINADLITIGRKERGTFGKLFLGSLSRAVVMGAKSSILVVETPARENGENETSLSAIVATDHSPYAEQCIEHLRELHPAGISHLTVLYVHDNKEFVRLRRDFLPEAEISDQTLMNTLEAATKATAEDLKGLAPIVESSVEIGEVRGTIRGSMEKGNCDLLILGAHGHTWFERIVLGSVSFHEAFSEPYSVLIIRKQQVDSQAQRSVA